MPRKKPFSAKQRKAQLQEKRAVKRGDASPPPITRNPKSNRRPLNARSAANTPAIESSKRLQSAFVKLSSDYLTKSKIIASTFPLPRPISADVAVFALPDPPKADGGTLVCPKRPKWRYEMSKKEVEKNEEGLFTKWLDQTDQVLQKWVSEDDPDPDAKTDEDTAEAELVMPRAPTHYERNLEVWRQLWRVTEISQILLILLDSRCPMLHYPPSLASYLASFQSRKVILVLTKVDISGADRANAWTNYINSLYPNIRVVQVEAYIQKELNPNETGTGKHSARFEPHLPHGFRERLVHAIREAHAELLEPPERIRADEEKVRKWKPPVKRDIDWDGVLTAHGGKVGTAVGGAAVPRGTNTDETPDDGEETETEVEPEFLTIGLIGQPNVGKSSLLNALFGSIKVRASRTPGKTKHFQTLFWTPDVRLVDCPGLVMPNFVPMEMQVLSGILPISRVSAVPACIYHASHYLPLEKIFKLVHPAIASAPAQDKRTWREERAQEPIKLEDLVWTAMDVLLAYAASKNWVTAKAGRPDVNRAGNAILRALAEGKIRWAFWPPGTDPNKVESEAGVWVSGDFEDVDDSDIESDIEENHDEDGKRIHWKEGQAPKDLEEDASESEEDEGEGEESLQLGGRFGALALEQEAPGTEDSEEEDLE